MAGVLPLLVKPGTIEGVGLWRRVVFRPGAEVDDLFDRLAAALVRQQQEGEGLPIVVVPEAHALPPEATSPDFITTVTPYLTKNQQAAHLIFYDLFCVLFDELSCASVVSGMSEEL
jgi:hypothetical protein